MTVMTDESTALLLIAHGSREPAANADLHSIWPTICGRPVGISRSWRRFWSLAEPDIDAGGETCVAAGPGRLCWYPISSRRAFMCGGIWLRPEIGWPSGFRASSFVLAEPLGPHPLLVEIVMQRASNSLLRNRASG